MTNKRNRSDEEYRNRIEYTVAKEVARIKYFVVLSSRFASSENTTSNSCKKETRGNSSNCTLSVISDFSYKG